MLNTNTLSDVLCVILGGAIADKNAHIGMNVRIDPFPTGIDLDAGQWAVRDEIVVVPENST